MIGLVTTAMSMSAPMSAGRTDWWRFFSWSGGYFPWIVLALELFGLAWYIRSTRKLAAKGHHWSAWRTVSFVVALVFISLALQSGIPILANTSFVAHVFQHMLMMLAAPPMIAMSAPLTLYLQTCPRQSKVRMIGFLKSRFIRVVTFPPIVWVAFYGMMFVFFLTPLLGIAMVHPPLMDLFNVAFFMGGGLFWWPTVGLDATTHWKLPFAGRLGNLFLGIPFESFLGIALMNNSRPVAPMYTVADTHAGGSVLWAVTELFTLAGLFMVMGQWMKAEERAAAREDRRLDALEEAARAQADGEIPAAAEPFGQFSQN